MTDSAMDPFDIVRRELLAATTRDIQRRASRNRAAAVCVTALGSLALLTGIAAAADDRVASVVGNVPQAVRNVFNGPSSTNTPGSKSRAQQKLHEDLVNDANPQRRGDGPVSTTGSKVLLNQVIEGVAVEIVASGSLRARPSGAAQNEVCYSVVTDDAPGGTICTSEFNPGLPINYTAGTLTHPDGRVTTTVSGIAADTVRNINIITVEGSRPATMGDHSFWWRSDIRPISIEVVLLDGESVIRAIE